MKQTSKAESLRQWYLAYIDLFRDEYEKLSLNEKTGINKVVNFLNPCQIEIFWLTNPDHQLVIHSNFNSRPDKEIIVNGPYQPHEFYSNVIAILTEKRWSQSLAQKLPFESQVYTYGEKIIPVIYTFMKLFENNIFTLPHNGVAELSRILSGNAIAGIYAGNIGDLDHVQKINREIQKIKRHAETIQKEQQPNFKIESAVGDGMGFGAHFFPPIRLYPEHKLTIKELFDDIHHSRLNQKAFDMKINHRQIIVTIDGFIFVEAKEKEHALNILNLIMACGVFYNIPLYAVREFELVEATYNKQNLALQRQRWSAETRRAYLLKTHSLEDKILISKRPAFKLDIIQELLLNAKKLLEFDEEVATDMRLFNGGLTNFDNSEFSQSFIMVWTVIERQCSDLWNIHLNTKNITSSDLPILSNRKRLSISYVLELLVLHNLVDKKLYERIEKLRLARNNFIHGGQSVARDTAEDCLKCAIRLICDKIKPQISISKNSILRRRASAIQFSDLW